MLADLTDKKDELAALCRKYHVRKLAVFGSALRNDFDPDRSDIDFRVEFDEIPLEEYVHNKMALRTGLEALFSRPIDLLVGTSIRNKYLRAEIESTQQTFYAA